jgi:hypothetical protein
LKLRKPLISVKVYKLKNVRRQDRESVEQTLCVLLLVFVFQRRFPKWTAIIAFLQDSCAFQATFTLHH